MEADYQDIIDLEKAHSDLLSLRKQWEIAKNNLVSHSCEVLKLKNTIDILAGHIDDAEELIRVKKLSINIKPR